MLSQKLKDEIDFLKRLGKRFATKKGYLAALKDMLDEGIITRAAYNAVVEYKEQDTKFISKRETVVRRFTPPQANSGCSGGWRARC